jgi:hypothetical protein
MTGYSNNTTTNPDSNDTQSSISYTSHDGTDIIATTVVYIALFTFNLWALFAVLNRGRGIAEAITEIRIMQSLTDGIEIRKHKHYVIFLAAFAIVILFNVVSILVFVLNNQQPIGVMVRILHSNIKYQYRAGYLIQVITVLKSGHGEHDHIFRAAVFDIFLWPVELLGNDGT